MHVFLENTAGMNSRTRKLTDAQVRQLRLLFKEGADRGELAKQFNITRVHVNNIVRRAAWESVE